LGTACTADHVQKLLRFTEQVVFSFDGDAAGRRAAGRALEAALPHASDTRSFRFLFLPQEHDPDSYLRAFGTESFEAQVRHAVPLSRQLLDHASADCDLQTAEGRSRMLAQARPLWQQLPEGTLRLQLLTDLARHGGLPQDELARIWGHGQHAPMPGDATQPPSAGGWGAYSSRGSTSSRSGFKSRWPRKGQSGDTGEERWQPMARRPAPKRPEDRVLQMLFGQPDWWDALPAAEHEFLHQLPAPHGALIAWLERDLAEHGARSWAVLKEALAADPDLTADHLALADGDADPGATLTDFRRALDLLLERGLAAQMQRLLAQSGAGSTPAALERYRELDKLWREIKQRQASALAAAADQD
jgi:DNA primase